MANAYRDQNDVPTLIASSNVDGFTPIRLYADPITHRLLVDGIGGGFIGGILELTTVSTVDGLNTAFVFSQKPTYIVSGGAWYKENQGWTWNAGTLTATMSVPPQDYIWGFKITSVSAGGVSVYTEILTNSGDNQNFTSVHNIANIFSIMDAYSGKGIPATSYSVSGSTLTLTSPDANLASDGIQLIYA